MLSSAHLVFSTAVARLVLGRSVLRHHYLASLFSIAGFGLVSFALSIDEQAPLAEVSSGWGRALGVLLVAGYLVCHSLQGCLQETLLKDTAISYQRMVGLEGMFGLLWSFLLITLASHVACLHEDLCSPGGALSDTVEAIYQITYNQRLMFYCASSVLAVLALNLVALQLARLVSAMYKAFWTSVSILIVWVVCSHQVVSIAVGFEHFYMWRALVQLLGLVLLVLGSFTYNEVIIFPYLGLHQDTKYCVLLAKKNE